MCAAQEQAGPTYRCLLRLFVLLRSLPSSPSRHFLRHTALPCYFIPPCSFMPSSSFIFILCCPVLPLPHHRVYSLARPLLPFSFHSLPVSSCFIRSVLPLNSLHPFLFRPSYPLGAVSTRSVVPLCTLPIVLSLSLSRSPPRSLPPRALTTCVLLAIQSTRKGSRV